MRLTAQDRRSMVSAIMADIPVIDYQATMRARALEVAVQRLPEAVRRVFNGPDKPWIAMRSVYCDCMSFALPSLSNYEDAKALERAVVADAEFDAAHKAHDQQREEHKKIKAELVSNLAGCSTRKQFVERFPELEKYAPSLGAVQNLPATTALVDHLRSAGLPVETPQ